MTAIKSRPVSPLSLMCDVFVDLEKLKNELMLLRDGLTFDDNIYHCEISVAKHHCRKIVDNLKVITSLCRGAQRQAAAPSPPQTPLPPPRLVKP